MFESFANSERYKTMHKLTTQYGEFESFANSERYKTHCHIKPPPNCLRALLIQKDTKPGGLLTAGIACLRALLIQKDTKHARNAGRGSHSLRALLIQKDTKLIEFQNPTPFV